LSSNDNTPAPEAGECAGAWPEVSRGTGIRRLTPREATVLALIAQGLTNCQIARRLEVSPRTIDKHVEHILMKLNVPSRAAAAARHAAAIGSQGLRDDRATPAAGAAHDTACLIW
jgi:DNA-binding NarL/FixJ family response regulator